MNNLRKLIDRKKDESIVDRNIKILREISKIAESKKIENINKNLGNDKKIITNHQMFKSFSVLSSDKNKNNMS